MIVAAAIRLKNGAVFVGKRHGECFRNYRDIMLKSGNNWTAETLKANCHGHMQGFITDALEFLSREDALEHAKAYKQVPADTIGDLFSEDLW